MCYSLLPSVFVGHTYFEDCLAPLRNALKSSKKYQSIHKMVLILNISNTPTTYERMPKLALLAQDRHLEQTRMKVNSRTMSRFLQNYNLALKSYLQTLGNHQLVRNPQQSEPMVVLRNNGRLRCQCSGTQKTGLPCNHMIRVLLDEGNDYLSYFHQRWVRT